MSMQCCLYCELPIPLEADPEDVYCNNACLDAHVDEAIAKSIQDAKDGTLRYSVNEFLASVLARRSASTSTTDQYFLAGQIDALEAVLKLIPYSG